MMGLVLHHGAKPFVGKAPENEAGLLMYPIQIISDVVTPRGEVLTMTGISTRATLNVFAVHPSLDGTKVANQIAEGPSIGPTGPFQAIFGNQRNQPTGPLPDASPVLHELCGGANDHGSPGARLRPTLTAEERLTIRRRPGIVTQ